MRKPRNLISVTGIKSIHLKRSKMAQFILAESFSLQDKLFQIGRNFCIYINTESVVKFVVRFLTINFCDDLIRSDCEMDNCFCRKIFFLTSSNFQKPVHAPQFNKEWKMFHHLPIAS